MNSKANKIFRIQCNDRICQAVFYVKDECEEKFLQCLRCGQYAVCNDDQVVPQSEIREATESVELHCQIHEKRKRIRENEMVKVLGLSNFYCKLVSEFLTKYGMDKSTKKAKLLTEMEKGETLDCSVFGDRAFLIAPKHIDIAGFGKDTGGMDYLKETLEIIKASNGGQERLVPIYADGDGHCLVHAISRALVGRELFWHPLRCGLKKFFESNLEKLKEEFADFSFDWPSIIIESDPNYYPGDDKFHGLQVMHIFGLANILRRPIVLLDSHKKIENCENTAVFLPYLIEPERCKGRDNTLNKPICIAWNCNSHNHFIPLVGVEGMPLPVFPKSLLPGVYGINRQTEIDNYIQFDENDNCTIGGNKVLQEDYILQLAKAMEEPYFKQYGILPSIVEDIIFYADDYQYNRSLISEAPKIGWTIFENNQVFRCTCLDLKIVKRQSFQGDGTMALHRTSCFPGNSMENWRKCSVCNRATVLHEVKRDGTLVPELTEKENSPQKSRDELSERRTEDLPEMLPIKITKNNKVVEDEMQDCPLFEEEALKSAILQAASNFLYHFSEEDNNVELQEDPCDESVKKIGKTPVSPTYEEMPFSSQEAKLPVEEKGMEINSMVEPKNACPEPKPSTSEQRIIKIVSPNGEQVSLKLDDQVFTYPYLQECIFKEFQIPIENQRIKMGFPPKVLEAPHNNMNQDLPLKHGDRLMVENCPKQENKSRSSPYIRNTARDFSSQNDVNAAFKNEMIWSLAKLNPDQFQKGGFVYEDVARTKILIDMVHMFIETFPNKTFAYNYTFDCIELCVKPLGHFLINPELDSRIEQVKEGESVHGYRTCPVMCLKTGHKDLTPSRSVKKPVGTNAQASSENAPAPLVRKGPGFSVLTSPDSSERMDLT